MSVKFIAMYLITRIMFKRNFKNIIIKTKERQICKF